jgi:hypothetical protein
VAERNDENENTRERDKEENVAFVVAVDVLCAVATEKDLLTIN